MTRRSLGGAGATTGTGVDLAADAGRGLADEYAGVAAGDFNGVSTDSDDGAGAAGANETALEGLGDASMDKFELGILGMLTDSRAFSAAGAGIETGLDGSECDSEDSQNSLEVGVGEAELGGAKHGSYGLGDEYSVTGIISVQSWRMPDLRPLASSFIQSLIPTSDSESRYILRSEPEAAKTTAKIGAHCPVRRTSVICLAAGSCRQLTYSCYVLNARAHPRAPKVQLANENHEDGAHDRQVEDAACPEREVESRICIQDWFFLDAPPPGLL